MGDAGASGGGVIFRREIISSRVSSFLVFAQASEFISLREIRPKIGKSVTQSFGAW
jgi:hypothetical protein